MKHRHPLHILANDSELCEILAEKLEIQADGGDSAGEFVSYAIREVIKQKSINYHEMRLQELKERP